MDPEVAYQRMITEQFDFKTNEKINTTYSVDNGQFSRFEFQSGLANGKGRFWNTRNNNNGSPLERFKVRSGTLYRFRIIGAMTLYPMRVYIYGHRLTLRTSDAYNVDRIPVQSIIVHPGERYDFFWQAPPASEVTSKHVLFIAETIETGQSLGFSKYHAAEAVLEIEDSPKPPPPPNPPNSREETCTSSSKCTTFNCPYEFYPPNDNRVCITFAEVNNTDPNQNYKEVLGNKVDEEFFFNFAFPGPPDNTPGSVNGRKFVPPTVSLLTQENELTTPCTDDCNKNGICQCTYIQKLKSNKLVQFVLLNLGSGSGWSHPVHLHGHSFYVMKMGFGTYNRTTGNLMSNSKDIYCTDRFGYCSSAVWTNSSWAGGRVPDMSSKPPQKDTIVVPTGIVQFVNVLSAHILFISKSLNSDTYKIYFDKHVYV
jgi:FtsP/CotA-like multicopper oxidase with cupredoxin domain